MNTQISVVTVVRNAVCTIEETLKSVISQSYPYIEYIVLDGISTDGTLKIIKKYESQIDIFRSERDRGIYDAMNKGIGLSTGDLVVLLNADDYFAGNCVETVVNKYETCNVKDSILFGDAYIYYDEISRSALRRCKIAFDRGMTIIHQAMFVPSNIYKKYGAYDLRFKNAADYDFALRTYLAGVPYLHIPEPLVYSRRNQKRASEKFAEISIREEREILCNHYGFLGPFYFYRNLFFTGIRSAIHRIIERILGKNAWLWVRKKILIYLRP